MTLRSIGPTCTGGRLDNATVAGRLRDGLAWGNPLRSLYVQRGLGPSRSTLVAMEQTMKALSLKQTLIEFAIGIIIALAVVGVVKGNWPAIF